MTVGIAVMAKAPAPGRSKTRLMPFVSPDQAAALSAAFLTDVTGNLALAARSAPIAAYVAYAPEGAESGFDGLLAPGTALILADGAGTHWPAGVAGFGTSLLHAVIGVLARGHEAACVLNADSPNLPTHLLVEAAQQLRGNDDRVVLGPAEDGGYYLLGMRRAHASLFADIAWSSAGVAEQTRVRARAAGLDLVELDPWYDVDEPDSLRRLMRELSGGGRSGSGAYPAPGTAACLDRIGLAGVTA